MCRYRYCYFATCRHQQTVLFDFCPNARRIAPATAALSALTVIPEEESSSRSSSSNAGGTRAEGTSTEQDDLPSLCSDTNTYTSHTTATSLDTGSASITAEPCLDCCASLPQADHPSPHSSPAPAEPSHDMAGLPLFGGTFRHWMSGSSATAPKQSDVDSKGHVFMSTKRSGEAVSELYCSLAKVVADDSSSQLQDIGSESPVQTSRLRQPGIREHTDESCDLPQRCVPASCHRSGASS